MKRSIFLCLALVNIFLWNCECEDLAPTVIEEFPDAFFVIDDENNTTGGPDGEQFFFSIAFSEPVDTSTIRIDQTVFSEGLTDLRFSINIGNTLFFSGDILNCDSFPCSGETTITLKGNDEFAIRSVDGQTLDGDKDGSDGGDFTKTFEF